MRRKYKLTWFARFVIFLLFLSPVCYFAASQYQTNPKVNKLVENVVEKIKTEVENTKSEETAKEDLDIDELQDKIKDLQEEIEDLELQVEKRDFIIKELKSRREEV